MNEIEKTTFIFSTHDEHVLKYARGTIIRIKDGLIERVIHGSHVEDSVEKIRRTGERVSSSE